MSEAAAPVASAAPAAAAPAAPAAPAAAAAVPAAAPVSQAAQAAPQADVDFIAEPTAPADVEFKVPEGVKPDDSLVAAFKPLAKELGLKGAGAQKLVDLYAATMKKNADAADAAFKKAQSDWRDAVKSDQEIGGQNFESTRVDVGRFFNAFDKDGAIRKAISEMGLGNHPALVRLAVRASKLLKEDSGSGSTAPGAGTMSDEEVLRARYPSMFPPK